MFSAGIDSQGWLATTQWVSRAQKINHLPSMTRYRKRTKELGSKRKWVCQMMQMHDTYMQSKDDESLKKRMIP